MPRFAANLSFLFQEVAFLDRFEAAAPRWRVSIGRVPTVLVRRRQAEYRRPHAYEEADMSSPVVQESHVRLLSGFGDFAMRLQTKAITATPPSSRDSLISSSAGLGTSWRGGGRVARWSMTLGRMRILSLTERLRWSRTTGRCSTLTLVPLYLA